MRETLLCALLSKYLAFFLHKENKLYNCQGMFGNNCLHFNYRTRINCIAFDDMFLFFFSEITNDVLGDLSVVPCVWFSHILWVSSAWW